jgi:superfamily II DNA or RNA helicase
MGTRKEYCQILYDLLKDKWNKIGIANGDYTEKHNKEQIDKIDDKEINILITTIDLLGEGFDVPHLDRGFLVLPTQWGGRVEQAVGRIQRTAENKKDAILYDCLDHKIGMLKNQYWHRLGVYKALGMEIER